MTKQINLLKLFAEQPELKEDFERRIGKSFEEYFEESVGVPFDEYFEEHFVELHLASSNDIDAAIRVLEEKSKSIQKFGDGDGGHRRMGTTEISLTLNASKRVLFLLHTYSIKQLRDQIKKSGASDTTGGEAEGNAADPVEKKETSKPLKKKKKQKRLKKSKERQSPFYQFETVAANAEAAIALHVKSHSSGIKKDVTNNYGQWEAGPEPTCDAWSLVYQRW